VNTCFNSHANCRCRTEFLEANAGTERSSALRLVDTSDARRWVDAAKIGLGRSMLRPVGISFTGTASYHDSPQFMRRNNNPPLWYSILVTSDSVHYGQFVTILLAIIVRVLSLPIQHIYMNPMYCTINNLQAVCLVEVPPDPLAWKEYACRRPCNSNDIEREAAGGDSMNTKYHYFHYL